MITVTYQHIENAKDRVKLELVDGVATNKEDEAKVMQENTPYEMIAVVNDNGEETRFDLEYPEVEDDDVETNVVAAETDEEEYEDEPEAYDNSIEEEVV